MPTMKSLLLAVLLTAAASLPCSAAPVDPPDYSGSWTLDRARSPDLPPMYDRVRGQRLVVAQSDARLVVDVEIDAGGGEPERFHFEYPLDGTEAAATTKIRTRDGFIEVPSRLRGARGEDGRIRITTTREIPLPGGQTMSATGTEEWELSPDGRTLIVHRAEQVRQGEERFDMVFTRD
ncbi:MAG TPA: hypothetical protein VK689_01770 [Armatimonadota bacterium]|nr:hypothetical protein [Armatimonadota bacterium]